MAYKVYALIVAVVNIITALSAYVKVLDPTMGIVVASLSVAILACAEYLKQEGVIETPRKR